LSATQESHIARSERRPGMTASREAFDLFHPACRRNFKDSIKRNWKKAWWWRLVISDTANRVCSKKGAGDDR
jgi:hypothetical protein